MANNRIQVKRTSVSGRTANVTNSGNSQYIAAGEFALNMPDGILYSSNGSALITVGANLVNQAVTNTTTFGNSSVNATINSTAFTGSANAATYLGSSINSGNSTGIYSTGVMTASGIVSGSELTSTLASGDEGGQINLAKPPNATTAGGVTIDAYQNKLRIFEQGGNARGAYIDLTACLNGVGTNLLGGTGTVTSVASANGIAGGPITGSGTLYAVAGNSTVFVNASGIHVNTSSLPTVNLNSQYVWTNTHTFQANISFTGNNISLVTNTGSIFFAGSSDANWRIGRNTGATTKFYYSNNTLDIIAANSNLEGIVFGWTGNSYLETGYAGTFTRLPIYIGNSVVNVSINSTSFTGTANNTSFVGSVSAANVVSNAQLSANLANYQTSAGLSANVATLTANSATYANSSVTNTFTVGTASYFVSNGNVGIGNTIPAHKLRVTGTTSLSGAVSDITTLAAGNTSISGYLAVNEAASSTWGRLSLYDSIDGDVILATLRNIKNVSGSTAASFDLRADQAWSRFTSYRDGAGTTASLAFSTTIAGSITEQMRIHGSNVGIGNTAPAHKLRVTGTTSLAGAVSDITTLAAGNTTITGFANVSGNGQFTGNVGVGVVPANNVALYLVKTWDQNLDVYGIYNGVIDNNTAMTVARNKFGSSTVLTNYNQNKSSDGLTSYGSVYYGSYNAMYNGSSVTGGDANASLMTANFNYVGNWANGTSANTITTARAMFTQVEQRGGIITAAEGIRARINGSNTLSSNITTAYSMYADILPAASGPTIGTGYLYYGVYGTGTVTTKYGLYLSGEGNNYLSGNLVVAGTVNATSGLMTSYANVTGQVNTATLYATTSANIASAVEANSTGVWTTGTVNAASHTVGTAFTANSTVVNAVSYNVGSSFIANSTALVSTGYANVSGNGYFGGNVGIGNSAPTHKLRVEGTTSLAGAVSNITTLSTGNTTVTGFANITTTLAAGNTTITGFANVTSTLAAGNTSISGTLTVDVLDNVNPALKVTQRGTGAAAFVVEDIASDTTPFTITDSGQTIIGGSSYTADLSGADLGKFQIIGSGTNNSRWSGQLHYASAPVWYLGRAEGTTTVPTVVTNGSTLGSLAFSGYGGNAFHQAATVSAIVDGAPGVGDMPGALTFSTSPDGNATPVEAMRIAANGNIGMGNTTPAHALRVEGTTSLAGAVSGITTLAAGNTTITGTMSVSQNTTFSNGVYFGSSTVTSANDTSRHISLYNNTYGFGVTSATLNYTVPATASHVFNSGGTETLRANTTGLHIGGVFVANSSEIDIDRLRLTATNDASVSSTLHAFQVGLTSAGNIIIDNNEIMARNNGAVSTLILNNDGGDITLGAATSQVTINGQISAGSIFAGSTTAQTIVSGIPTYQAHDTTTSIAGKTFASVGWGTGPGAGSAGQFLVAKAKSGTVGSYTAVASGDALGRFAWAGANSTAFNIASEIQSNVDGTPTGAFVPSALSFRTSNTTSATNTRLYIGANGNVGVGTSTPAYTLGVSGTTNLDGFAYYTSRPTAGTGTGLVVSTGNLIRELSSSRRFKYDIKEYPKGLQDVLNLNPVLFKYINDDPVQLECLGFIAEEVNDIGLTEVVQYDANNDPYSINYGSMVALLTNAIKEQQAIIENLTTRIETLENKV